METTGKVLRKSAVNDIREGFSNNKVTFLLSYSAISSYQMSSLRKELKGLGARVRVTKNRLAKIALKELKQEEFGTKIGGQIAFVWSDEDSSAISKTLTKFVKECQGIVIKGAVLDGNLLTADDIKRLADLPSREVLLSQLLATIQSPVSRLLSAFNAKSQDLLSILKQLSEKKEGGK